MRAIMRVVERVAEACAVLAVLSVIVVLLIYAIHWLRDTVREKNDGKPT